MGWFFHTRVIALGMGMALLMAGRNDIAGLVFISITMAYAVFGKEILDD